MFREYSHLPLDVKPILLDLPGVSVRVLHRGNEESGQVVITRMAPGAIIPEHWQRYRNRRDRLRSRRRLRLRPALTYGPGTFFSARAGKPHGPHTSSTGCTVLTHFSHAALDFNVVD